MRNGADDPKGEKSRTVSIRSRPTETARVYNLGPISYDERSDRRKWIDEKKWAAQSLADSAWHLTTAVGTGAVLVAVPLLAAWLIGFVSILPLAVAGGIAVGAILLTLWFMLISLSLEAV